MPTLVIEHSALTGSDRFGEILRDCGHRLDVRRVYLDDPLPPDLDGIDAVVACGGPQSPLAEDIPWMNREIEILRDAHAAAIPIVAFCLGSQLLGRALGATITPLEGGIEAGWHDVTLLPAGREDPVFAGHAWTSVQLHWHRMQVGDLPPDARVLARSARTPVQSWAIGLRTYAFQYHPEAHAGRGLQWADDEPGDLKEASISRDRLEADTKECFPAAARLADRLFERLALMVMPLDRRFAGIAKDLHH
ncbi:MAG: type 1 glutamine amidotransferase [Phycisphaerales bacterium]|nr:type 1 glutamine amidotransferase [Phycisphaerales bacterium]